MIRLAVVLALIAGPVLADPPPPGSPDEQLLSPYSAQIKQAMPGPCGTKFKYADSCCGVGDGTVVDAHIAGDHWEIKTLNDRFPKVSRAWQAVPDDKVLRCWPNPTGNYLAWFNSGGTLRCFAPLSGT